VESREGACDAVGRVPLEGQARIVDALNLAEQHNFPSWVSVDKNKMEGVFKAYPDRSEIAADVNESLIVELYSR